MKSYKFHSDYQNDVSLDYLKRLHLKLLEEKPDDWEYNEWELYTNSIARTILVLKDGDIDPYDL